MKTYLSSIPMLVYRLGRRDPDKVAVIDSDLTKYSYRQLNAMADAIRKLFPLELPKRVGILMGSGIKQIASVLAAVKNGVTYVPLDPALNGAALRAAASNAEIDFIITDEANASRMGSTAVLILPSMVEEATGNGFAPIRLNNRRTACMMPGSRKPLEELSCLEVRRNARSLCDKFDISDSDVVLQSAVISSPMFLAEVFATLMKGATLAILPEKCRSYATALADFADRAGVTVICTSRPMAEEIGLLDRLPSRLRMLLSTASDRLSSTLSWLKSLRRYKIAGADIH